MSPILGFAEASTQPIIDTILVDGTYTASNLGLASYSATTGEVTLGASTVYNAEKSLSVGRFFGSVAPKFLANSATYAKWGLWGAMAGLGIASVGYLLKDYIVPAWGAHELPGATDGWQFFTTTEEIPGNRQDTIEGRDADTLGQLQFFKDNPTELKNFIVKPYLQTAIDNLNNSLDASGLSPRVLGFGDSNLNQDQVDAYNDWIDSFVDGAVNFLGEAITHSIQLGIDNLPTPTETDPYPPVVPDFSGGVPSTSPTPCPECLGDLLVLANNFYNDFNTFSSNMSQSPDYSGLEAILDKYFLCSPDLFNRKISGSITISEILRDSFYLVFKKDLGSGSYYNVIEAFRGLDSFSGNTYGLTTYLNLLNASLTNATKGTYGGQVTYLNKSIYDLLGLLKKEVVPGTTKTISDLLLDLLAQNGYDNVIEENY